MQRGGDLLVQAEQCMEQLRQQLNRENTLICDFVATFFKQVRQLPQQLLQSLHTNTP